MSEIKTPEWIITERIRISANDDYRANAAGDTCERCGARLIAEVWKILHAPEGKIYTVGSTCVKALTGMTVTQLRGAMAEYVSAVGENEHEKEMAVKRTAFFQANQAEMEFLDAHIERIQKAAEKKIADWQAAGAEMGTYPRIPDPEFWLSLRQQAHDKGILSEKQMSALRREMGINHEAVMPAAKSKGTFEGKIERVNYIEGVDHDPWKINLILRAADGSLIYVKVNEGTALTGAFLAFFGLAETPILGEGRKLTKALEGAAGRKVTVKATVQGSAAVGGKLYLTRASLVSIEGECKYCHQPLGLTPVVATDLACGEFCSKKCYDEEIENAVLSKHFADMAGFCESDDEVQALHKSIYG